MNYYDEIKEQIINNEITKKVKDYSKNRSDLTTYYNVGKLLAEAGKHYGEGIIKEYSKKLINDIGKSFNESLLKRFRQFYLLIEKGATMSHQLLWSQYVELIPINDIIKINYYINKIIDNNLTVRQLRIMIKNREYERLPESLKTKLISQEKTTINDLIPNPILIKNTKDTNIISEKLLHQLIINDIELFLRELGNLFCFIGSEYKIKIGENYNYIDLLLYNIEFNCYVVIELKITELKKEYIGQIQIYMNYIDSNLKTISQDKTIGIIICKKDNKYIMEYASDDRILAKEYKLV